MPEGISRQRYRNCQLSAIYFESFEQVIVNGA